MPLRILKNRDGFTYIAAMMVVVIMGIMLGAAGQTWKSVMQREREEELIFRGTQIRDAINRWWTKRPGQHPPLPIKDLKDLQKSPYELSTRRFLRRLYKDPVTGKDFEPLTDPVRGIYGVKSTSDDKPLKQANFPLDLKDLEGKDKYSDWWFIDIQNFPTAPRGAPAPIKPMGAPGASPFSTP